MWFILTFCIVGLAATPITLRLVPPPNANIIVRIRGGDVHVARGKLRPHARQHVQDILAEAEVSSGFISVSPGKRVVFSRHIPVSLHQSLRNVLLNQ
jgi:hypothetical protein